MTDNNKPPWENIRWRTTTRYILNPKHDNTSILLLSAPNSLSTMKDRIIELDDDKWEYYKKITNRYELIFTSSGKLDIPPSVCTIHPLSRSYFKMIEMLYTFNQFNGIKTIKTGHVCEGPGGFIQAIYDYACRHNIHITKSTAMTLKPTHNYVPGWRRATNFLKKNPQIKIIYGDSGTGDILVEENRASYVREVGRSLTIFTADGGVDFTTNYRGQEQTIFPLLIASSILALRTLVNNGTFILKIFDCIAENTMDLIVGLGTVFKSWTLYKPATSRPCNSEQYFVGVGFNTSYPMLHIIINTLEKCMQERLFNNRLWTSLPMDVTSSIYEEQIERMDRQIDNLELTFLLATIRNEEINEVLWEKNISAARDFCRKFSLPQIIT
jgi:23S rRNA U2552 (ribose-2'-O)-methylase RlmE/FtsJ